MLKRARQFFEERGVLEVDTPVLSKYPVSDPHIETLSAGSASAPELFLQTSPEYRMKQLLAAGFDDIYQICKVFRGGERGPFHSKEFTLVEWYRLNFGMREMIAETIEFIAAMLERPELVDSGESIDYEDLFQACVNLNPRTAGNEQLAECVEVDARLVKAIGDDRDAWLDLILARKIVPEFAVDRLTVVRHYPASQAALARLCPDDPERADRFEIFFGTLELANGFVELTDADEQLARFEADQAKRRRNNMPVHPLDEDLIEALRAGLPPCAGVAIGLERLLMLHARKSEISEVSTFNVRA